MSTQPLTHYERRQLINRLAEIIYRAAEGNRHRGGWSLECVEAILAHIRNETGVEL
jgi:hypothetical protein